MKQIKNRVLKQDFIDWRLLEWLQGNLKEITDEGLEQLIHSIMTDDIIKCFHVWENEGKLYCLDGNHLKKALFEIEKRQLAEIPDRLKADFIECKDINEAAELVLKYSAVYTNILAEGLDSFIEKFKIKRKWGSFKKGVVFPGVDLKLFENIYINNCLYKPNLHPIQNNKVVSEKDIKRVSDKLLSKYQNSYNNNIEVICPYCGRDFVFDK